MHLEKLVLGLSIGFFLSAVSAAQEADVRGGKDHPLISRYAGASILAFSDAAFEDFGLPIGVDSTSTAAAPAIRYEQVPGKRARLLYVAPAQRSTLEVFTNYRQALERAGFRILFSCGPPDCGRGRLVRTLYPVDRALRQSGQASEFAFSIPQDERYISAVLVRPSLPSVYVSLYMAREGNSALSRIFERAVILQDVIEPTRMETGRVTVDAAAMGKALTDVGRVALYEIYFDTGNATVKPESDAALGEIAALLKADPQLRLFVVGHTDSVGSFQSNLDLSKRRAAAVVAALTTVYGIAATRLQPEGVGMLAPLASNESEGGRARNRRVELVRR